MGTATALCDTPVSLHSSRRALAISAAKVPSVVWPQRFTTGVPTWLANRCASIASSRGPGYHNGPVSAQCVRRTAAGSDESARPLNRGQPDVIYPLNPSPGHDRGRAQIEWVIAGIESGASARPRHPDWASSLCDQCTAACVPFLFKQWGEHVPNAHAMPEDEAAERGYTFVHFSAKQPYPIAAMDHAGKRAAGRQLDDVKNDGFPGVVASASPTA